MADRGASAAFLTELVKDQNEPFHLFELQLDVADGGTVRNTDLHRDVSWGGNSYLANGHFMQFSGIQESAELRVKTCSVTLSGVDQAWIATVLTVNYIDRRLLIYKGFVNATTDAVIVDPIAIFDGRVDSAQTEEDPSAGTCSVTLTAADDWVDFERLNGRHTNPTEQQALFPSDLGFQYVDMINKQIQWGA